MRKIVAGLFVSLDGVVEAPENWSHPYVTEEVGGAIWALIAAGDTLLLGRKTYETFKQSFGSGSDDPMAAQMSNVAKVVVSTTLATADWQNSTLISGDVAAQIAALKQQPGSSINMSGSGTLVGWLLQQRLLDKLDLLVLPVAVGSGKHLFEGLGEQRSLQLTGSTTFANGVVHLTYEPASDQRA